jgi:hypothetical protein
MPAGNTGTAVIHPSWWQPVPGSCRLLQGPHLPLDPLDKSDFRRFKIIFGLKVHPALGVGTEETGETQGGVSGDGPISGTDFINAALGHTNGLGQPVAGDLLIAGIAVCPAKTDPPSQ